MIFLKQPKIAVIIATLDEEENIGNLIDSLNANSYKKKEIIVVDDGSKDNTVKIAKSKGAIVLVNNPGRRGPAFGWNRAVKFTDAEIVGTMDADYLIEDKKYLENCAKAFEDPKIVSVFTAYHTIQDSFIEKIVTDPKGFSMEPRFSRKEVYLAVGGFPEIGFGEDQLFTKAIKDFAAKNGMKTLVLKNTFFSGHGVHDLKAMYKQAKWYGKTSLMFIGMLKGTELLKQLFGTFFRLVYFLSFLFVFLIPFNILFAVGAIPFFAFFLLICLDSFKNLNIYHFGRVFTFLIFGFGMLHGLLIYLSGLNKGAGA